MFLKVLFPQSSDILESMSGMASFRLSHWSLDKDIPEKMGGGGGGGGGGIKGTCTNNND